MTTRHHKQKDQEPAPTQEITPVEELAHTQTEQELPAEGLPPVENTEAVVDVASLPKELDEARTIAAEYLDGWQRSMAEFANYKKRVERDREQVQQNLTGTIVKRYLEVVDDLERALKTRPKDGEGESWANGIELIYRKLLIVLDSQEVKPMDALGQPFDPNRHEAIGHMESAAYPSGHVAEVVQNGYIIGDRVLRPALVRIVH
jgi:molecular chaperone GrpE